MRPIATRRTFFQLSAAAVTLLLSEVGLARLLPVGASADKVQEILATYLGLGHEHRQVIIAFTRSLGCGQPVHRKSAWEAGVLLRASAQDTELARYVVEEFLATTNYLTFSAGKANDLVFNPEIQNGSHGRAATVA